MVGSGVAAKFSFRSEVPIRIWIPDLDQIFLGGGMRSLTAVVYLVIKLNVSIMFVDTDGTSSLHADCKDLRTLHTDCTKVTVYNLPSTSVICHMLK